MKGQEPLSRPGEPLRDGEMTMKEVWAEAAKAFETICGKSLQGGDVRSFDDVQKKIEGSAKASYGLDAGQVDKWDKAKGVGLKSLKYLKMLIGAASQASSFIPLPSAAISITTNALMFVFDIPEAIKGYNDAINSVFNEVSSALSQFRIYNSMDNVEALLVKQIHLVMVSFVKICGHVVKYRQGRTRHRVLEQVKSIFADDSGLGAEMAEFKRLLQQQRDVEGTVTLSIVAETRSDIAVLLEKSIIFAETAEETRQVTQETQKGVQSLNDDADRTKSLNKIRDTLGVPSTVRLDTRTTQTCISYHSKCLDGTGSWIWTNDDYTSWAAPKDKDTSHVLLLSGPSSSGKTSASALITKRLEEKGGRNYVSHYFFPASTKKSDEDKYPVQSALKYMAFQIARADATVQKALAKACDNNAGAFRTSANLESLWTELRIGSSGSGATYYLVFDGLENLPDKQAELLLKFIFGPKLATESAGRVRVLISGTDDKFLDVPPGRGTLRIQMEENNESDMRIMIDEALNERGMLQHAKPGSDQYQARAKIVEKLPRNVEGKYSLLQFGLDRVIRLLSMRTALKDLDLMLEQSMSSHAVAIEELQRSLTTAEINELNEILIWVLYSRQGMDLNELEAILYLYSGIESLASLQHIIKTKYSAVLKTDGNIVYGQDGVEDCLKKDKNEVGKTSRSKDQPSISMTITINKVDEELCRHFFWDLAHKAIREKFKFDFDAVASSGHGSQAVIAVDEFEAHHTILKRAFQYLSAEDDDHTNIMGRYMVCWIPHHLESLRTLEDEEKGSLSSEERLEIGQHLYDLFTDQGVVSRHKKAFQSAWWVAEEVTYVQKWLMDSAVVRRVDKKWRDQIQFAASPVRGYLKGLGQTIVREMLRSRDWDVDNGFNWIQQLMEADEKKPQLVSNSDAGEDGLPPPPSPPPIHLSQTEWDEVSNWCQGFLGLEDSELDSLWYERLGETAVSRYIDPDVVVSLIEKALAKENPSWICHRGMARARSSQGKTLDAVAEVEKALSEAEKETAVPKAEKQDIVALHALMGDYAYEADDMPKAMLHYDFARKSDDPEQAKEGELGYLKARLRSTDVEGTLDWLRSTLAGEPAERQMYGLLRLIAQDMDHENMMSKTLDFAKADLELLSEIVRTMETATTTLKPRESQSEAYDAERFADEETRGVLLYHRALAAVKYNLTSDGTEPVGEALRLWRDCREQLAEVGGVNAFSVRADATTALAKYYFGTMLTGNNLDHMDSLSKLADIESYDYHNNTDGFLCTLHALHENKDEAQKVQSKRMKQALQILSDDVPDNDTVGFDIMQKILAQTQDLKGAAIALSLLGQPDLVTETFTFEAKDVEVPDDADNKEVVDLVFKLAAETIQAVKAEVPDPSQQLARIKAAKNYVKALKPTTNGTSTTETNGEPKAEVNGDLPTPPNDESALDHQTPASNAQVILEMRLVPTLTFHDPVLAENNFQWNWSCDGRDADGKRCLNSADFSRPFYHCLYCSNQDFCEDCFGKLQQPLQDESHPADISSCSPRHKWIKTPPLGNEMFVGATAKKVRVPEVRAVEGYRNLVEVWYPEQGQELEVEKWKEDLAKEWGIELEETNEGSDS